MVHAKLESIYSREWSGVKQINCGWLLESLSPTIHIVCKQLREFEPRLISSCRLLVMLAVCCLDTESLLENCSVPKSILQSITCTLLQPRLTRRMYIEDNMCVFWYSFLFLCCFFVELTCVLHGFDQNLQLANLYLTTKHRKNWVI